MPNTIGGRRRHLGLNSSEQRPPVDSAREFPETSISGDNIDSCRAQARLSIASVSACINPLAVNCEIFWTLDTREEKPK